MISEIRLINYRKFVCERIPLEPMTVFIGPNAGLFNSSVDIF
jgi:predicted ATPase